MSPCSPTPQMVRDAQLTVTSPQDCVDRPGLRANAWFVLMTARGLRFSATQIGQMQRRSVMAEQLTSGAL